MKLSFLLKVGDKLILVSPKVKCDHKATQPPARFNVRTLIEDLEKRGIGRPSTYASITAKITDRNYVICKNNVFIPTDLGKQISDNLTKYFDFVNYKYTSDMETQLDLIAEGKLDYITAMKNFYIPFSAQLKKAYSDNKKDYGFKCEKCDEKMDLRHGIFGFYLVCPNRPECKNSFSVDIVDDKPVKREIKIVVAEGILCPRCNGQMSKKDGKFGPFYSCISPKCNGSRKIAFGKACSDCGGDLYATIYCGQNVLFCMNYSINGCKHKEIIELNLPDPKKLIKK
jgi:DNA topoisomerase-1